jgi:hypothetical protein
MTSLTGVEIAVSVKDPEFAKLKAGLAGLPLHLITDHG